MHAQEPSLPVQAAAGVLATSVGDWLAADLTGPAATFTALVETRAFRATGAFPVVPLFWAASRAGAATAFTAAFLAGAFLLLVFCDGLLRSD